MKLQRKALFLLLFLVLSFQTFSQKPDKPDVAASIDKLLNEKYPADKPGAAVIVVKDGKTLLRKGYGLSHIDPDKPVTPDVIFRIGSITKQFTSTAILKLVDQRKIDLQDDITTYLKNFTAPSKVTVEQLLNHTSGIKSYTSLPEIMNTEGKAKSMTVDEMLAIIQKQPEDFKPGEQWLYNNSAYFLLGAIIEKVTGETYDQYIHNTFLKPLGMKSTFVNDKKLPANVATGYAPGEHPKVADYVHPSIPFSAGSIFSTVDDLWKWNKAVFGGEVIKKDLLEKAWSPAKINNGQLISYGYGWQLGKLGESKVISHGGGIDGFVSFAMYVPDHKLYVCLLSNNMSGGPQENVYEVAEIVLGMGKEAEVELSLEEAQLEEYTGVYQISASEERIISRMGKQLFSQRTGSNKFEIYPVGKDLFAFRGSSSKIRFIRDSQTKVVELEIIGREWINQKSAKTDKPIPAERLAIEIDPIGFDKYAGEYELFPNFIIKIWREEANYKAQATGQPVFEIFPESPTKFFLKVVDAQMEFNSDDQGNITGMTLFQGGRVMPGKKIK